MKNEFFEFILVFASLFLYVMTVILYRKVPSSYSDMMKCLVMAQ